MKIWGHRGAYDHAPENTLCSFEKAIELGADGVEFDVQLTRDGEIVVIHDERIDRVSDCEGFVKDYTLAELKKINFNKRGAPGPGFVEIPTLDEVLQLLARATPAINIELKTGIVYYDGIERKTVDTVRRYGLSERVLYSSFNHYSVQKLKAYARDARIALLCGGGILVTGEQCEKTGAYALHPSVGQMRYPGLIADCKGRGVKVHVWTVTCDTDFAFAAENGVDAVFVNDLIKYKDTPCRI
jgi:glycerophosphoryl diester phosphodiesterase